MQSLILKANAKKMKKKNLKEQDEYSDDDSNEDLTSDDENEVSKGIVGEFFNNRYYCLKYLGRGTFSRVWIVYDIIDCVYRAMKVQFPEYYKDSLHEIKIMNTINNKNNIESKIVKLFDSFLVNKTNHMIYELLGMSLLELFRNSCDSDREDEDDSSNEFIKDIPINTVKILIKDILLGLVEAHEKGIIHTDLKPENILLNIENPKITRIKKWFDEKEPDKIYKKLLTKNLPDNFYEQDKNKRKTLKKKAKIRSLEEFKLLFTISCNDFESEINDNFEIDYNNLRAKIVDFGNGEFENDLLQEEISLRCYRCPENIINEYYNTKADIWVVGCMCYELLTKEYLFDIDKNKKSIDRNKEHLHQMYEILGKMPKNLTDNCDFSDIYFDSKGRILKYKKYDEVPISDILYSEFGYSEYESDRIEEFLLTMLEYDPKKRYSAKECLNNEWLKNT